MGAGLESAFLLASSAADAWPTVLTNHTLELRGAERRLSTALNTSVWSPTFERLQFRQAFCFYQRRSAGSSTSSVLIPNLVFDYHAPIRIAVDELFFEAGRLLVTVG